MTSSTIKEYNVKLKELYITISMPELVVEDSYLSQTLAFNYKSI